jgi:DNA-binding MarR family transcriptional regulator
MRYKIEINLLALSEMKSKISLEEAVLLDYLYWLCTSPSEEIEKMRTEKDGKQYTWFDYGYYIKETPILRGKSKQSITPKIKKLEEEGFIETFIDEKTGRKYVRLLSKVDGLFRKLNAPVQKTERPPFRKLNIDNNTNIDKYTNDTYIVGDTSNEGSNKENTNKEEPFNSESYIQSLINSPQRHLQVIGIYWNYKHYKFENKKQAEKALKRDLRPATDLAPYSNAKIFQTMDYLDEYADYKWTLETVFKYVNEDIDELIAKEEAKIREKHRPY